MRFLAALVFIAFLAQAQYPGYPVEDIIRFPWMAYIISTAPTRKCSGSVIGRKTVMTEAYCTCNSRVEDIRIITGTAYLPHGAGRENRVLRKYFPPEFGPGCKWEVGLTSKVAILVTTENIVFDSRTQPIEIELNAVASRTTRTLIMGFDFSGLLRYYSKDIIKSGEKKFVAIVELKGFNRSSLERSECGSPSVVEKNGRYRQIAMFGGLEGRYTTVNPYALEHFISMHGLADFLTRHLSISSSTESPMTNTVHEKGGKKNSSKRDDPGNKEKLTEQSTKIFGIISIVFGLFGLIILYWIVARCARNA